MSGLELLPMFFSAAGAGLGAVGTIQAGKAADAQARQDALNMEAQGKEELAAAQREAMQKRREGALINSRALAVAAASGGGADDPTIVRLMTQTASEAETNAGSVMFGGRSRQRGLNDSAKARRREGKASLLGSYTSGFGQAASGFGGLIKVKSDPFGKPANLTPEMDAFGRRKGWWG